MQHKNIHIIKHAKQIKTNTALDAGRGPGDNASLGCHRHLHAA
jgi:hypothetical protein